MAGAIDYRSRVCHSRTPRRRLAGLTLVETLAAFVLLGLLSTLVIQAVGFFSARYDGIQRVHRATVLESLGQNWFATTVRGLVPVGVHARRFVGGLAAFEGTTLEPLYAERGTPVIARWSIDEGQVRYAELAAPGADGIAWTVRRADALDGEAVLSFEYGDALGNWHDRWPPAADRADASGPAPHYYVDPAHDWTPRLIRLVATTATAATAQGTVWLARVEPEARPLVTEDAFR